MDKSITKKIGILFLFIIIICFSVFGVPYIAVHDTWSGINGTIYDGKIFVNHNINFYTTNITKSDADTICYDWDNNSVFDNCYYSNSSCSNYSNRIYIPVDTLLFSGSGNEKWTNTSYITDGYSIINYTGINYTGINGTTPGIGAPSVTFVYDYLPLDVEGMKFQISYRLNGTEYRGSTRVYCTYIHPIFGSTWVEMYQLSDPFAGTVNITVHEYCYPGTGEYTSGSNSINIKIGHVNDGAAPGNCKFFNELSCVAYPDSDNYCQWLRNEDACNGIWGDGTTCCNGYTYAQNFTFTNPISGVTYLNQVYEYYEAYLWYSKPSSSCTNNSCSFSDYPYSIVKNMGDIHKTSCNVGNNCEEGVDVWDRVCSTCSNYTTNISTIKNSSSLLFYDCDNSNNNKSYEWVSGVYGFEYVIGNTTTYDCMLEEGEYGPYNYYTVIGSNTSPKFLSSIITNNCGDTDYVCSEFYDDDYLNITWQNLTPAYPCAFKDNLSCLFDFDCASNNCNSSYDAYFRICGDTLPPINLFWNYYDIYNPFCSYAEPTATPTNASGDSCYSYYDTSYFCNKLLDGQYEHLIADVPIPCSIKPGIQAQISGVTSTDDDSDNNFRSPLSESIGFNPNATIFNISYTNKYGSKNYNFTCWDIQSDGTWDYYSGYINNCGETGDCYGDNHILAEPILGAETYCPGAVLLSTNYYQPLILTYNDITVLNITLKVGEALSGIMSDTSILAIWNSSYINFIWNYINESDDIIDHKIRKDSTSIFYLNANKSATFDTIYYACYNFNYPSSLSTNRIIKCYKRTGSSISGNPCDTIMNCSIIGYNQTSNVFDLITNISYSDVNGSDYQKTKPFTIYGILVDKNNVSNSGTSVNLQFTGICGDTEYDYDEVYKDYGGHCGTCFDNTFNPESGEIDVDYGGLYCGQCANVSYKYQDDIWNLIPRITVPFDIKQCEEGEGAASGMLIIMIIFLFIMLIAIIILLTINIIPIVFMGYRIYKLIKRLKKSRENSRFDGKK